VRSRVDYSRAGRHYQRAKRQRRVFWLAAACCWLVSAAVAVAVLAPDPSAKWLEPAELRIAGRDLDRMLDTAAAGGYVGGELVLDMSERHLAAWANRGLGWVDGPAEVAIRLRPGGAAAIFRLALPAGLETTLTAQLRVSLLGDRVFYAIGRMSLGRLPIPASVWRRAARDALAGAVVPGTVAGWAYHGTQFGYAYPALLRQQETLLEVTEVWLLEGRVEVLLREVSTRR